jgi:hypothetical protein
MYARQECTGKAIGRYKFTGIFVGTKEVFPYDTLGPLLKKLKVLKGPEGG